MRTIIGSLFAFLVLSPAAYADSGLISCPSYSENNATCELDANTAVADYWNWQFCADADCMTVLDYGEDQAANTDPPIDLSQTGLSCGTAYYFRVEDTGNVPSGCSADSTCTRFDSPPYYTFTTSPCPAVCGDGAIGGMEECDDANTTDSDGCSSSCVVEEGYECTDTPSACSLIPPPPPPPATEDATATAYLGRMADAAEQNTRVTTWGAFIVAYLIGVFGALKIFWSFL